MNRHLFTAIISIATASLAPTTACAALNTAVIESTTGLKGTANEAEGTFKITAPRSDVKIAVDGWTMPPFMGLTTWATFKEGVKAEAMCAGDLVLFEDEVNPVMSVLFDAGLTVTALHNHFMADEPKVYFMHIAAEGAPEALAKGVKAALDKVKEIRTAAPQPVRSFGGGIPATSAITAAPLAAILPAKPQEKDGMAKFVIGRTAKMACGCEAGKELGVNTWAAFGGTDDNAFVCGDFACRETELTPVLKSLRASGINIVAIHHHMILEEPRYVFLHYWGRGKALELATKLKAALATQEQK